MKLVDQVKELEEKILDINQRLKDVRREQEELNEQPVNSFDDEVAKEVRKKEEQLLEDMRKFIVKLNQLAEDNNIVWRAEYNHEGEVKIKEFTDRWNYEKFISKNYIGGKDVKVKGQSIYKE